MGLKTITCFEDLLAFCKDSRVNYKQAVKAIEAYCSLIVIDNAQSDKAELISELRSYIQAFAELPKEYERPLFMILNEQMNAPQQD
jgi:DNA recombination-dependent growth factor C